MAGSGVVGLLIYAGFFYANLRRTSSTLEHQELRPSYPTQAQAEQEAERWIEEGGTFTVKTTQRFRRTIPLTRQERLKLELLADEKRRALIEADYEACLNQAATDLAKELCSFQQLPPNENSTASGTGDIGGVPSTKVIEDVRVQTSQRPRRTCTPVSSYRRLNCIEFDVDRNEEVSREQQNSLEVRGYRQFRY
ncbi:hypothetical protein SynBIOSE41_01953 [Synechococcus sp. BIOS-E4-1]|uniref:hypothetical protein n=1 Tax=Synechococcus sp. BIOS-E4-1 TaxID=1400864 RepID=UPI001861B199|nr:hypothetical protein [Synechococcus sp. BIOS-E4-1]QNI54459.1 hypothetical protein SynBIOSE41_01953 [Synechococcus sp. BIOS-E4-1]